MTRLPQDSPYCSYRAGYVATIRVVRDHEYGRHISNLHMAGRTWLFRLARYLEIDEERGLRLWVACLKDLQRGYVHDLPTDTEQWPSSVAQLLERFQQNSGVNFSEAHGEHLKTWAREDPAGIVRHNSTWLLNANGAWPEALNMYGQLLGSPNLYYCWIAAESIVDSGDAGIDHLQQIVTDESRDQDTSILQQRAAVLLAIQAQEAGNQAEVDLNLHRIEGSATRERIQKRLQLANEYKPAKSSLLWNLMEDMEHR